MEHLENSMAQPVELENGATTQYRWDIDVYHTRFKKDRRACFIILASMHDDLFGEYENYPTTKKYGINLNLLLVVHPQLD